IFIIVGGVGIYCFVHYFTKDRADPNKPVASASQTNKPTHVGAGLANGAPSVPIQPPPPDPLADLTQEQRYVAELVNKGRIRLAARARVGDQDRAWVQWIDESNNVIEELDLTQLRSLGYSVSVVTYGIRLSAGKHIMVATAWPWTAPIREKDARLYNMTTDGSGGAAGVATAGSDGSGADRNRVRGSVIEYGPRTQGTFPESKPYQTATTVPDTTTQL
ncbi:filamentous phage phiLf protein I, partial [Xanthomonas oryzae pv. oryzae]